MTQTIVEKINQRERQIYMGSYLYYEMNTNVISDSAFDKRMVELSQLREEYPDEFRQSEFYKDYKDWEEGSGAFLKYDRPSIRKMAKVLYHIG